MNVDSEKQERVLDAFRRWGYLQANLDPLGHFLPFAHPELDMSGDGADAQSAAGARMRRISARCSRRLAQRRRAFCLFVEFSSSFSP